MLALPLNVCLAANFPSFCVNFPCNTQVFLQKIALKYEKFACNPNISDSVNTPYKDTRAPLSHEAELFVLFKILWFIYHSCSIVKNVIYYE